MACRWLSTVALAVSCIPALSGTVLDGKSKAIRVEISGYGPAAVETIFVKVGNSWLPALSAQSSPVRVQTDSETKECILLDASRIGHGLALTGDCGIGQFEQRITLSSEDDELNISTRLTLNEGAVVNAVEDRYDFIPARHSIDNEHTGPLDFVWSQNIKSEADDLIPTGGFKSPTVMLQQGKVFTALIPRLSKRHVDPVAMDLDVTSGKWPWISYGAIPSQPHGHSYFRRISDGHPKVLANTVEYSYSIVASRQPPKLGYRTIVRRLWTDYGHPELLDSSDAQQNIIRTELSSFGSWRKEAWHDYADRVYLPFNCGTRLCGTLSSNRSISGDWQHGEPDAWFNAWFQTLRTAYGWYLYGHDTHNAEIMSKAESVLTLALSAPQEKGAFPAIYEVNSRQWVRDDGWAGYKDDYHSFCMSWTAYWMLRWADDLTPQRKSEVLHFVRPYAEFLLREQLSSGVIPSWYDASLRARAEFRDFNAETGVSALFLTTLGKITGDEQYIAAAERAMNFISKEVIPRQRWYDFETFLSCARKDFDFYDRWTTQFPQNNLAEIQATQAWLVLYQITHKREYLERGTKALDYLLLTQQVWNNPIVISKADWRLYYTKHRCRVERCASRVCSNGAFQLLPPNRQFRVP